MGSAGLSGSKLDHGFHNVPPRSPGAETNTPSFFPLLYRGDRFGKRDGIVRERRPESRDFTAILGISILYAVPIRV